MSLMLVASTSAHPARMINAQARVESDGNVQLTLNFDLLAYLLNESPANASQAAMGQLLDGSAATLERQIIDAQDRMLAGITIASEENRDQPFSTIALPSAADIEVWKQTGVKPTLPVMQDAVLAGRLPATARMLAFRFPEAVGDVVLTIERPGEEASSELVSAGNTSVPLPIRLIVERKATEQAHADEADLPSPIGIAMATRFLQWGFTHIVPNGLDHILFVLGLFLLSEKLKPLLLQVTAFTLAHSITLALSMLGVISLPSWIVEPLIAASIAFIAIENLFTSDLKPWRPFVVFGFGLVHGLGFAGVLREAGLPNGQFLNAIVAFNVGVELGQLTVIAVAALLVGWFRQRAWYRGAVSMPASLVIALVAIFWTIERIYAGA